MFPQYRKLSNQKSFYKIKSHREFEEIQIVGSSTIRTTTKDTKYPEIMRIKDMMESQTPYEPSTKLEFNSH